VSRRILIVDDEPYLLRILSFKLRRQGYLTFEASCAEEAEEILERVSIDLVLLDVALATPTTGFELAERMRQRKATADTPIIMLTARGFADDILRGRKFKAAGYLTKPFSTAELIRRVDTILESEEAETSAKRTKNAELETSS
jgi:DNA-binding response OmpR family regulator